MHEMRHFPNPPEHMFLGRARQIAKESMPTPIGPQCPPQESRQSSQLLRPQGVADSVTTGQVTLDINCDFAVITFSHRGGLLGASAVEQIWRGIVECARRASEIRMVFIWAREAQASTIEGSSVSMSGVSLDMLCAGIQRLPQPVFGFAEGFVCNAGTCILAACDVIFAASWASFAISEERAAELPQVVPLCLLRHMDARVLQHLLETPGTVPVQRACEVGFVKRILQSGESLYDVQEQLCKDFRNHPLMFRSMIQAKQPFVGKHWTSGEHLLPPGTPSMSSDGSPMHSAPGLSLSSLNMPLYPMPSPPPPPSLPAPPPGTMVPNLPFTQNQGAPDAFGEDSTSTAIASGLLESALSSEILGNGFPASTSKIGSVAGASDDFTHQPHFDFSMTMPHLSGYQGSESAGNDGSLGSQAAGWRVERQSDSMWKARGARGAPKKKDLMTNYLSHDGPITSFMLCNIPCRITQQQLAEVINAMGFKDKYDFLYLPTGGRSSKTASNLGYGFINFSDPADGPKFIQEFNEYKFESTSSSKVCMVKPAHIQGLQQNMRHFGQANSSRFPMTTLPTDSQVPFTAASSSAR